jgi:hypothetical protein
MQIEYLHQNDATANDQLVSDASEHSLIINATGMGYVLCMDGHRHYKRPFSKNSRKNNSIIWSRLLKHFGQNRPATFYKCHTPRLSLPYVQGLNIPTVPEETPTGADFSAKSAA